MQKKKTCSLPPCAPAICNASERLDENVNGHSKHCKLQIHLITCNVLES